MKLSSSVACVLFTFVVASIVPAANWSNWRGPERNGVAPPGAYPIEWGADENVAWTYELPALGGSTPMVWDEVIVLTAARDEKNVVICLDRAGNQLWETEVGEERPGKHARKGSGCNPSPLTDGERIFVYYKSGDFAALDFDGDVVWHHNLQEMYGEDTLWWDLGSSPALTSEHVVVACMQTGPSYLAAFDPATGDVAWKVDRNLDAPVEAAQSYSTPFVVEHDGQEQIVVLGADHVTCHDAASGAELWRVGGLNPEQDQYFRSISSPAVTNDVVIAPYARGNTVTGIRLGGDGDVTDSHVLWTKQGLGADVPVPVAIEGRAYVCTDNGKLACLDVESGDIVWEWEPPRGRGGYSSSPILAGGYLYLTREDGTTLVVRPGDEPELVAENLLGEYTIATPVFVDGIVLIRTEAHLYCIGE